MIGLKMGVPRGRVGGIVLLAAGLALTVSGCTATTPHPTATATHSSSATNTPQPDPTPTDGPNAAVTIAGVDVDGRNLTVGGFVAGVSESGGTCDFVLTSVTTGAAVKTTTTGVENVQTTSCGSAQIPIGSFQKGSWKVVLEYSSPTTKTTSEPITVQVP